MAIDKVMLAHFFGGPSIGAYAANKAQSEDKKKKEEAAQRELDKVRSLRVPDPQTLQSINERIRQMQATSTPMSEGQAFAATTVNDSLNNQNRAVQDLKYGPNSQDPNVQQYLKDQEVAAQQAETQRQQQEKEKRDQAHIQAFTEMISGLPEEEKKNITTQIAQTFLKSKDVENANKILSSFLPQMGSKKYSEEQERITQSRAEEDKTTNTMDINEQQFGHQKELENQKFGHEYALNKMKLENEASKGISPEGIESLKEKIKSNPALYTYAKLYAIGQVSDQEMNSKITGFSKSGMRLAFAALAVEMNPPKFDEAGNQTEGFNPKEFSIARGAEGSAAKNSAKVQDAKVTAANSAMVLLNHAKNPTTGEYSNEITPQMATELAMNAARLISPTGQIAEGLVKELKQNTAQEVFSRLWGYFGNLGGQNLAGTTQANLRNIENFVKREGTLAQKERDIYLKGNVENVKFNAPELTGGGENMPSPKTQQEYDALPSGSIYIDTDGLKKRKK